MRALVWIVALYLLADFCDPGLPGAFTFNADTSVEVVHAAKPDVPDHPLRDASPERTTRRVVVADDPALATPNVVGSLTTTAARSSMIGLRPPRTQLSPEEGPAASAAA